jgi:hypothetical protein
MSNCIKIEDNEIVTFSPDEIDIPKIAELVNRVKDLKDPPNDKTDWDGWIAWWFLAQNTDITEDNLMIQFGRGRSMHTIRDFRQTIRLIEKHMKRSKQHVFKASGESDGFKMIEPWPVIFEPRSALPGSL